MKTKKLIAMLCVITLLSTIIALPVSAADPSVFTKYVLNDSFDSSLGNWKLGSVASSTTGYSLGLDTFDGATVMKFVDTVGYGNPGSLPNISNFLDEPLTFTDNSKVTVKTRFYHTGNSAGSGIVNLKFNRPDTGSWYANNASGTQQNETGMEWYTIFRSDGTSFRYMKDATNTATNLADVSSMGKWVEVELSFDGTADGNPEDVIITAKYGGQTYPAIGTVKQYMDHQYNIAGYTEGVFDSIKNFTWLIRAYANTLYVDYFQIIEERPYITISSAALEKNKITAAEDIKLILTTDGDIPAVPEDAVYIEGIEADFSYDSTNKTVTLNPKSDLTPGAELTVKIDKDKLYTEGIKYDLATEFNVNVSDVRLTSVVIDGHSVDGEAVAVESYSYESSKPPSTHEYQWQMSATGEEGTFTDIEGATSDVFGVTAAEADKYLRVKMTPYADNNGEREQGSPAFSNIIMPEFAPEISSISFNTETPYTGSELSLTYDFDDKNGENEDVNATVIEWYTASDADSDLWDYVYTGRTYAPVDGDFGKYIKCVITPYSDSEFKPDGARTPTGIIGPVVHPLFVKYHINDEFNTDLGNWKLGATAAKEGTYSLDLDETNGYMVLSSNEAISEIPGATPNAINDFDDVAYTDNSKLVIKTRFKQVGNPANTTDNAGITYLKFNRPDQTSFTTASGINELGVDWYTFLKADQTALKTKNNEGATTSYQDISTLNKWIEVEIVIDGTADENVNNYTFKAKIGDTWYDAVEGSMKQSQTQAYDDAGVDKAVGFTSLNSLTWLLRKNINTLYVDYFKVIEESPYVNATATLESDYVATKAPIKVVFTSDLNIHDIPEDAVYIDGVESEFSYDSATKTVTLTPFVELASDTAYAVKIDSEKLEELVGVKYSGDGTLAFNTAKVSVNSLVADGRNIPGTTIEAKFEYASNYEEGTHQYQWQMSETGEEGTFTDIVGATTKDFTVTNNEYGKYLRLEMIPYTKDGENGFATYSNVITPEKMPVASNVAVSTTTLFANIYLSALYDYSDENGDSEGATEVRWYTSDTADGEWNEVHVGATYYVTDQDTGKYIKCTVTPIANSERESRGVIKESVAVGPVTDLLASTNLFTNPDFETGELGDWKAHISTAWEGIKIQDKDVYEGNYGLQLLPSRQSVNESYGQEVNVTSGKTYVLGVWAKKTGSKLQNVQSFVPYCFNENVKRNDPTGQYEYSLTDRWTHVVGSYIANTSVKARFGAVSFVAREAGLEAAYLDNFYLGEAVIADIETYEQEPITIPESGSTSVAVTSGKALNQLGTQHGLWNEKVVVSIPETQGVYVDGNNIVVTDTAVKSSFVAEIYCVPSYAGATQAIFQKFVEIDIVPHNDPTPRITSIDANGTVNTGATLTGEYTFYQVDGKEDASEIRWMYSDSENGVYYDIPGAEDALTYTVEAEYADKYIKMAVVPKTADGLVGEEVRSVALTMPRVPVASNVEIKGKFNVGETVEASYLYDDPNRDDEGEKKFQWYVLDSANGEPFPIAYATLQELTLTDDLVGKYIKVGVTPVSSKPPYEGIMVLSDAYAGPAAPVAMNVSVTQDETRLVGNYDFYHIHNARETDTVYEWTIDGKVVSNEIDYVIGFTGTKTVTFTVTPVADSNPARGASVPVSATITGNSGGSGGGGGSPSGGGGAGGGGGSSSGGSGGGGFTSGVTSVNDMQLGTPEEKKEENTEPVSDINGHWGEEYIEEMVSRGVMSADENGKYNPDELVTREGMLTYLFKTLGLETSEYQGIFEDVDGEFADMLQTMVDNGTIAVDTHFRPADNISREEMCKILYISLDNAGKLEKTDEMLIEAFEDFAGISDWAKVYVNGVYANKIMIGVSDTHFAPQENLTKAQAATLLTRIIKLIEGEE